MPESGTSKGGHWKSKLKRSKLTNEEDLAVPWSCEEVDPFIPRICNFKSSRKTRMPNNVKTYDGIEDLEDHVKNFQAAAQVERWAMPTWCHMFNSTLIGTAREKPLLLPKRKFKLPESYRTSPNGKTLSGDLTSEPAKGWTRSNKFTPLTRTPKEIFTTESGKFKSPPPMVTPIEKRSSNKFYEFYNDKGHSTDECVQLRKQIEELVRAGRLSQFIKEIRRDKDQQKMGKKDAPVKDKSATIYMIQPWQRVTRQKGNYMAARTAKALGNYKGCRASYKSVNELRDSEKKLGHVLERSKAIQVEVQKLVEAGILREVYYHDWLSNPVMVKKHDGSWRMCVEFTNLNKACLQDCYPLPKIDWKVESLCGYLFKCFHDAYKGYHQIQMAEQDEEKMAIHTSHGVYCYTKMTFGLKNVGVTYQRLVDQAFDKQMGWNLKIYVDDLVIKSHTDTRDIEETFRTLRKINMKLNPKKCTFRASEGMFLGYMINPEGIKSCPDKTEAVLQLPSPRIIKEVQSLNGKLASLKRFICKSAKKSLPLFKTLKKCIKKSDFYWTPDVEQAFKQQKQHLAKLPMVVAPKPKEELIVYLSASHEAISAVLMTERDTILPGASHRGYHRAAHQASDVTSRRGRTIEKIERNARGAQFHIPTTDICERQDPSRLPQYEALIAGLRIATQMEVRNVLVSVDSKLMANQVLGTYVAKEENMVKYLEKAKSLISGFDNFSISQVPRSKNKKADALSKITSTSFAHLSKQVLVEVLKEKSIQEEEVATMASKLRIKARQYELWEGVLYRRSFLKLWLRRTRQGHVFDSRYGLFHKVDISESRGNNHRRSGEEVRVARHSMPLRSPRRNSLGQRETSVVQWTRRESKPELGRRNQASSRHAMDGGKLDPKWEGPYEVTQELEDRAYRLRSRDGVVLPRTWNAANLKKSYV
nr:reverse transcriptase domain-containing protein [Tanacetum cinerariifolium]